MTILLHKHFRTGKFMLNFEGHRNTDPESRIHTANPDGDLRSSSALQALVLLYKSMVFWKRETRAPINR